MVTKEEKEMEGNSKRMKLLVLGQRGPSTPSTSWRLHFSSIDENCSESPVQATVSARKLCANLWEILPHRQVITPKLTPHDNKKKKKKKNKAFELHNHLIYPPNKLPDQPPNANSSRRHVADSVIQHRKSIDRNRDVQQQPLSSANRGRSIKVAPLNPVESPSKSFDFKGGVGESSSTLKTSSELLKVLNRIWSLEEKQSCNVSLLKSLKTELNRSHSQIKELLKEKQSDKQEMDTLMQQVAGDKVSKKYKEQEQVKALIQSAQAKLEGERKLRKHSESHHLKLARELSDAKSAFSNVLKELERERKARILLENLCDEFAKGIRDYEQEVHCLRRKPDIARVSRGKPDRLILHISEAWLDERMQMGLAESQQNDVTRKNTILDKLSPDIETFLLARHSNGSRKNKSFLNEAINNCSRRESFPLNEAVSAPQDVPDGEDSDDSDLHCYENTSTSRKQNIGRSRAHCSYSSESHFIEGNMDSNTKNKMTGSRENKKDHLLACSYSRFNLKEGMLDSINRNQSVSSEEDKIHPEDTINEDSFIQPVYPKQASPMQKWKSKLKPPEFDNAESLLQLPDGVKENTLKAKLLEARLEGSKFRATAATS